MKYVISGCVVAIAGGAFWASAGHPMKGAALIAMGVLMAIFEIAADLFGRPKPSRLDR
jgi:hypothetical protein